MCINKGEKHIAFLLGAGFSVPAGYPTAGKLNTLIASCNFGNIGFSPSGKLCISNDGNKPNFGYRISYDDYYDFLKDVIIAYCNKYYNGQSFDYEKFYDYIKFNLKNDNHMRQIYNSYKNKSDSYEQYCYHCEDLYNQLLFHLLKDNNGNWDYSGEPFLLKQQINFPYIGFLECVEHYSKEFIVDIHTLNHDLFIDRLRQTEWINGNMCDGFEELGSPFYGEVEYNQRKYRCRLEYYTDIYRKPIRLYKLHGSLDYYTFYDNHGGVLMPGCTVKTKYGINTSNLLKEISKNHRLEYEKCGINYHPNFLSGTTAKVLQYDDPLFYKRIIGHFEDNLSKSDILVVIGYSGGDSEINKIIEKAKVRKVYVVDSSKYISNHPLVQKGAIPLNKGVESLSIDDIRLI